MTTTCNEYHNQKVSIWRFTSNCFSIAKIHTVRIQDSDQAPDPAEGLNPKVVEVYTKCAIAILRLFSLC